jgi:hypothetical protein
MTQPRAAWFLHGRQQLCCAAGHVIPWTWEVIEDGFPRCQKCGRRVYILMLPLRVAGQPLILVADVSGAEIRLLLEQAANVKEVLATLGLTWSAYEAKQGLPPPTMRPFPQAS